MANNPQYTVLVGDIVREHGVRGFCKVLISPDYLDSWNKNIKVKLKSRSNHELEALLVEAKPMGRFQLSHFSEFSTPEALKDFRGAQIFMNPDDIVREKNQIFDSDWVGFVLRDQSGRSVGKVDRIVYTPLKQFEIKSGSGESILIPAVQDWILECDQKNKTLTLEIPEGLLPDDIER